MEANTTETEEASGSPVHALVYLALTLSLAVLLKFVLSSQEQANIPPVPARPFPVLGHLPYLTSGTRKQINTWRKSAGDVFCLYFGSHRIVILNGYDVIHKAFVKKGDTLSGRPETLLSNVTGGDPYKGISAATGKGWKEQRSTTLQILRSFGVGKNVLAEKVSQEVSEYLNTLSKLDGQPSDVATLTSNAISNVTCSIVVGKRFEYDDAYFVKFMTDLEELAQLTQSSALSSWFSWLQFIPFDLFNAKKRRRFYRQIIDFFCYHFIEKTKNEDEGLNRENFISAYLLEKQKLDQQGKETGLNEHELARIILELFFAGTVPISAAILWFMVHMVHYPDIQTRIFEEISEAVGTERSPTMNDRTKLNLLNATIMESQRIAGTPDVVPHCCTVDTEINGYTLPAGTTVIPNLDSVLMCPDIWKEPMKFQPERFLDAQGNATRPPQFIPFSIGRRACPGEPLAKMELFLFLSSMIQRFELMPAVPGELPSLEPVTGSTYAPQHFHIRFVDRREV